MGKSRTALRDPLTLFGRVANRLNTLWLSFTYPFAAFGKGSWVHRSCELERSHARYISIGNSVCVHRNCWVNVAELPSSSKPVLILEDGCSVGRGGVISAKNLVHIKHAVVIGPRVFITDHNHAFEDIAVPIVRQGISEGGVIIIEEGCWIGCGAAIVCSRGKLIIGRNSVIGANALVTRSVEPFSVVGGNPARTLKKYDCPAAKWLTFAELAAELANPTNSESSCAADLCRDQDGYTTLQI